jgi:MFS family permease
MPLVSRTFSALEHRPYRMLWSGSMLATTAFMMSFMLVPTVAFEISGSNEAAGLAQMGQGIAMLLVSPLGGVIADRVRKKPLVLAGQSIPASMIVLVGFLILTDRITVPLLMVATLIMGLGFSFMGPARQAWVGELVPSRSLPNAIALQQIAQNIAQVAAPLCVAVLLGHVFNLGAMYLFMAALFVVVLPLTLRLPNTPTVPKKRLPIRTDLAAGVRYVWSDLRLRTLWLGFVGLVVCGFAFQTLLPGLLRNELHRPTTDIGPIFLSIAIAGLVVNIPLAGIVGSRWAWPTLLLMGFVMSLGFLTLAAAPTYVVAIAAGIPLGIGRAGFMLVTSALLMTSAEPRYHGRVMSLMMMGFGSQALLAPLWGFLADHIGVRQTLLIVGAVAAIMTSVVGLTWLRIRRPLPVLADSLVAVAVAATPPAV